MNQEKIGNFIAQCRKEKNLTQSQLAEKLNMSNKSISKWETGKGMPDSSVMLELCNYLGISVNELLSGEYLKEEQYQEKANENIINIAKESEKNRKIKKQIIVTMIIIFLCLLAIIIGKIVYEETQINVDYDERLVECKIEDNNIICSFNGLSFVTLDSEKINTEQETLLFVNGKMLLQNKIHSHFEIWDSMAQLNSGKNPRFSTRLIIDKNENDMDWKEKIKVYYTKISLHKIKNASQNELQEIIEQSHLMAEQR